MPKKEMFHIGMVPPPVGTPQQIENSIQAIKQDLKVHGTSGESANRDPRVLRHESMKAGAEKRYEEWEITYQRHKKVLSHLDQHR